MDIQELESKLKEIGYSLKGNYPNRFIFDYEDENTSMRVHDDKIEFKNGFKWGIYMYFDRIELILLDNNCLNIQSIHDNEKTGFFMQLYGNR